MSKTNNQPTGKYNLNQRTIDFSRDLIQFAKTVPQSVISTPIISQLIRAGTSIGANYAEADGAESKNDFIHKLGIAKKEAKETQYWLNMVAFCFPNLEQNKIKLLKDEAQELILILSSIINKLKTKH